MRTMPWLHPAFAAVWELNLPVDMHVQSAIAAFSDQDWETCHSRRLLSALYFTDLFSILGLGNIVAGFHQTEKQNV